MDMCIDMREGMCIGMCEAILTDAYIDLFIGMCETIRIDMCINLCTDAYKTCT